MRETTSKVASKTCTLVHGCFVNNLQLLLPQKTYQTQPGFAGHGSSVPIAAILPSRTVCRIPRTAWDFQFDWFFESKKIGLWSTQVWLTHLANIEAVQPLIALRLIWLYLHHWFHLSYTWWSSWMWRFNQLRHQQIAPWVQPTKNHLNYSFPP